jgi:hypothetical protein
MLSPSTCSPDTAILWGTLPQFVQDQDTLYGYPFLSWLEGGGSLLQATDSLSRDSDGFPGWSCILDVNRCPTADLPWLAQFVGIRFTSLQQTDASQRAAIANEAQRVRGFGRGTLAALQAAIAPFVTSMSSVVITERSTDAYNVQVTIPNADLAGLLYYYALDAAYATYAALDAAVATYSAITSSSGSLLAAITSALPAGLVLTLTLD